MADEQAPDQTHQNEAELTLSMAADACGVSRSTMRRARESGKFPRSHQRPTDGAWLVPVSDLLRAGFTLSTPQAGSPQAQEQAHEHPTVSVAEQVVSVPVTELLELRTRLAGLEAESAGLRELVRAKDQTITALESRAAVDLRTESVPAVQATPSVDLREPSTVRRRWWRKTT